jgi:hypothetical protein
LVFNKKKGELNLPFMTLQPAEPTHTQRLDCWLSSLLKLLLIVLLDQCVTLSHCDYVTNSIWVIKDMVFDTTVVLFDIHLDSAWDCWAVASIDAGYELFCHSCTLFKQGIEVNPFGIHLLNRLVNQLIGSGIDFDALLEQGTAMMEQLMAGIDPSGPTIPGTIEMDIEQDDGTIKHHVFDNLDRPYHTTAMNYCDLLIQQYDRDKADRALQPPVKPLRAKLFGFF